MPSSKSTPKVKVVQERTESSSDSASSNRWPFCIVWTPLPVITWLVPIIGHTGVTTSKGIIYDFSDDFDVTINNFSFGSPTKVYQFNVRFVAAQNWDQAIKETADYYSKTRHSLFFNNCHQYIADVLNKIKYEGRTDWTQTNVWYMITFKSFYVDFMGFIRQWLPFTLIFIAIILFLCVIL